MDRPLRARKRPRPSPRPIALGAAVDLTVKTDAAELGRAARRHPAPDRERPAERAHAGSGPARLRGGGLVGPGCGRRPARPPAAAAGGRAHRRSLRRSGRQDGPARGRRRPASWRSTARKSASSGLPATSSGSSSHASRRARPTPRCSTRGPSTPSSSTRPARPRAPCAATRKSPGSRARRTSQSSPTCSGASSTGRRGSCRPGGRLVYCTCSLEPEEGEGQAEAFLARHADFVRHRLEPAEIGGLGEAITAAGDLRTLPCHLPSPEGGRGGLDGFFAARFVSGRRLRVGRALIKC